MKVTRNDETVVNLLLEMSADKAETLRNLMLRMQEATLRADEREVIDAIISGIGRIY